MFVVGFSLILLMVVFRSIVVPIKATLGFLLSVITSFGVVVLVFHEGVLAEPLGITETGPVISFLPIILMGILFGLAMDYEVFLVSGMPRRTCTGRMRGPRSSRASCPRRRSSRRRRHHDRRVRRVRPHG